MTCPYSTPHDLGRLHSWHPQKTWRSPVEKADGPSDSQYKWLHEIADAAVPRVRRAFLDAIERIKGKIAEAELRAAIESGSVDQVLEVLGLDKSISEALSAKMVPPLEDTFLATGRAAVARRGELTMRFDISNPAAVRFLQAYDFGLIRQVTDETRAAVRNVVTDAFRYGGHPREQARQIREFIGLTERQTQAVINYRNALVEEERPIDQVERMTAAYRTRMLRLRGENIARTETLRASNAAQNAAWVQATDDGLLDRGAVRRQWLVTPDDRLCPYCAVVPLMNVGGVALGGFFQTPLGAVPYPPLHPQCRCITVLSEF